ncbi:MAG: flagellin, partial [Lawsonibacter sp.]|nr:flagellin [Lawsonibacter sp.]
MRIQHNIAAMNAYRNYSSNSSAVAKNLEKLSSGYKINRAGDDAAGLAISEKMRAQVTGLDTAQSNAKDGISLVQTAEGALTEVHDMLNRMYELSDQSANGTYDNEVDRANLQKEITSLSSEINRIADSSNFNGIQLLDGSMKQVTNSVMTSTPAATVDGTVPGAATKASATIVLDGTNATTGGFDAAGAITGGTTTYKGVGDLLIDGKKISDLFDVTMNGSAIDLTDNTNTVASGATLVFTAKNAGQLSDAVMTGLTGITADSTTVVAGQNEGAGTAATKSDYSLTFDFAKLSGGQTFSIGDKTFEISTGAAVASGNVAIDISGKSKDDIASAVATAISGSGIALTQDGATPSGMTTEASFTLDYLGTTAGDAGNLGAVRVSESATGAIAGTYVAGQVAGPENPGTFATATYDFKLSNLAAGDKITIGSTTVEVVDAADEDLNSGKISLANATDGAKLSAAVETAGYASGKVS